MKPSPSLIPVALVAAPPEWWHILAALGPWALLFSACTVRRTLRPLGGMGRKRGEGRCGLPLFLVVRLCHGLVVLLAARVRAEQHEHQQDDGAGERDQAQQEHPPALVAVM